MAEDRPDGEESSVSHGVLLPEGRFQPAQYFGIGSKAVAAESQIRTTPISKHPFWKIAHSHDIRMSQDIRMIPDSSSLAHSPRVFGE